MSILEGKKTESICELPHAVITKDDTEWAILMMHNLYEKVIIKIQDEQTQLILKRGSLAKNGDGSAKVWGNSSENLLLNQKYSSFKKINND